MISCSIHSNFGCTETPDGDAQRFCRHAAGSTPDPKLWLKRLVIRSALLPDMGYITHRRRWHFSLASCTFINFTSFTSYFRCERREYSVTTFSALCESIWVRRGVYSLWKDLLCLRNNIRCCTKKRKCFLANCMAVTIKFQIFTLWSQLNLECFLRGSFHNKSTGKIICFVSTVCSLTPSRLWLEFCCFSLQLPTVLSADMTMDEKAGNLYES